MNPSLECHASPQPPPSSGTRAPGSHKNGLLSAQLPNDRHLERSLMNVGQCCHHCVQLHILGGRWGQPHGAGCVRDPSIPVQLRRSRHLESMSAKHKNPLATCTQPLPHSRYKCPLPPYHKYLAQVDRGVLGSAGEDAHGDKVANLVPGL